MEGHVASRSSPSSHTYGQVIKSAVFLKFRVRVRVRARARARARARVRVKIKITWVEPNKSV